MLHDADSRSSNDCITIVHNHLHIIVASLMPRGIDQSFIMHHPTPQLRVPLGARSQVVHGPHRRHRRDPPARSHVRHTFTHANHNKHMHAAYMLDYVQTNDASLIINDGKMMLPLNQSINQSINQSNKRTDTQTNKQASKQASERASE